MDCEKAGTLMLKHFDKNIKTKESLALTKHILDCESCREYYLAIDESFEIDQVEAPTSIGINIMSEISKLNLYKKREKRSLLPIFWGISIVLTGILLFITLNPDWVTSMQYRFPLIESISIFLYNIGEAFTAIQQNISETIGTGTNITNAFIALLIAGLIAALFIVLNQGEKRINT